MQTSSITQMMARVEVWETFGFSSVLPLFNFMTLVAFATASTPESANTTDTNPFQLCSQLPCSGRTFAIASLICGITKQPSKITTTNVGNETKNANPAECLGPK